MIQRELDEQYPNLRTVEFVNFEESGAKLWRSLDADDQDQDVKNRAHELMKDMFEHLLPQLSKESGKGVGILVAHQTYFDCLLQVLLDGTDEKWRYGSAKYKLGKACALEIRANTKEGGFTFHRKY
jgi:hypothetical protein